MKKDFVSKDYFKIRGINSVIKFLTISDILVVGGFGLLSPVFAVFVVDGITGGNVEVVGIAQMIFLLTSSLLQVPIALFIDKVKGEKDDFLLLFWGTFLSSFIFFLYIFIETPVQLYIIQFAYGAISAFALPSWYAIFTRHVDKKHEGVEWGVYNTLVTLASAGTAGLSGFVAYRFGFDNLFIIVGVVTMIGSLFLLGSVKKLRRK